MTTDDQRSRRLEAAQAADPITNPWGVRTADPYPAGLAMFFWYPNEDALRAALLSGDHALDAEDHERDAAVVALTPLVHATGSFAPERSTEANAAAYPAFNILWWGTFEDLCAGEHDEAIEAREAFLSGQDDDYGFDRPVPPIGDDARPAFAEFLTTYGV